MNKNGDLIGVALVKEACPLCGALQDGPIIMNTRLSKHAAKEINDLNGKTVSYSEKPCADCQSIMDQAILIIGIVDSKTTDPKNPYRSGNKWGVKEDLIRRMISSKDLADEVIRKRAMFLSTDAALKMGFPDVNLDA